MRFLCAIEFILAAMQVVPVAALPASNVVTLTLFERGNAATSTPSSTGMAPRAEQQCQQPGVSCIYFKQPFQDASVSNVLKSSILFYRFIDNNDLVIGLKADGKKAGVINMLCATSTTTFDFVFFDDSAAVAWRTGLGSCGSGSQQASSKDFQETIVGPAVDLTCHCG